MGHSIADYKHQLLEAERAVGAAELPLLPSKRYNPVAIAGMEVDQGVKGVGDSLVVERMGFFAFQGKRYLVGGCQQ